MKNTTVSLAVTVMVAITAFWIGDQAAMSNEQAPAPVEAKPALVERFEIIAAGGQNTYIVMIDTTTGETWQRLCHQDQWFQRIPSPVRPVGATGDQSGDQ